MANISIDQLAAEMAKGLAEYSEDVIKGVDVSSEKVAKEAVKKLRATSPKATGNYGKGWTVKTEKKYGETNSHTIHNKNKPGLAHLLEHGHAKRGGGRVQAKPHIRPVEQDVINEFMSDVENIIRNG